MRVELLVSEAGDFACERLRGMVVMERSAYAPPSIEAEQLVVEEMEGDDAATVVAQLFRLARDNAAIARRVLRHDAESAAVDQVLGQPPAARNGISI